MMKEINNNFNKNIFNKIKEFFLNIFYNEFRELY